MPKPDAPGWLTDEILAQQIVCHDADCPVCAWWRDVLAKRLELRTAAHLEEGRLEELAALAGAEANLRRLERARGLVLPLAWVGLAAIIAGTILLATTAATGAAPLFGAALAFDVAAIRLHRATR